MIDEWLMGGISDGSVRGGACNKIGCAASGKRDYAGKQGMAGKKTRKREADRKGCQARVKN